MKKFTTDTPWTTKDGEAFTVNWPRNAECLVGEYVEIQTPKYAVFGTVRMTEFWPQRPATMDLYLKGISRVGKAAD